MEPILDRNILAEGSEECGQNYSAKSIRRYSTSESPRLRFYEPFPDNGALCVYDYLMLVLF